MKASYSHQQHSKRLWRGTVLHRIFLILLLVSMMVAVPTQTASADPALPLPRMPICGDQDGSETPFQTRCASFVPSPDVPTYEVPGIAARQFLFDFVFREATYNNELGMFKVDSAAGAIGSLLPGDPGYLAAAFQRKIIIFHSGSQANTPDTSLSLQGGDTYVFYIIQGNTTASFRTNNPNNSLNKSPLAFFSLESLNPDKVDHFVGFHNNANGFSQFGFEDLTNGGDKDYDDVVYNISPALKPEPPQPAKNPPLVLVHGWQGGAITTGGFHCTNDQNATVEVERFERVESGSTSTSNSTLKAKDDALALADWLALDYDVWIAHLETSPSATPSLEFNAQCLRDQINFVYSENPQPITIVAHSMGGVVSRSAIGLLGDPAKMIKSLYTLGSPHAGLPTDVLMTLKIACEIQVGACNMSISQMLFGFNPAHPNIKGIDYFFIGGTTSPFLRGGHILYPLQKNDGLVSSYSAVGWLFPSKFFVPDWAKESQPGQYWTGETHSRFYTPDNNYYSPLPGNTYSSAYWCIKALSTNQDMNNYRWACEQAGTSAQSLLDSSISGQTTSNTSSTQLKIGHLDANQSVSIPLAIDTNTTSLFYLTWNGEAPTFSLTRPDHVVIDPSYTASHPTEVTFASSLGGADAAPFAAYDFASTQPGTWQLNITATGAVEYQAFASFDSTRTLTAATNAEVYNIGDSATITATLQNSGVGIAGANVEATLTRPDGLVDTLPLVDQGNGIYAALYTIPAAPGYLTIAISANGTDQGIAFSRQEFVLASIKSNDLQLTGSYSDQPRDANHDGLYEKLDFGIGVNLAQAGEYSVTAELYAGNQLITQAGDFFDLANGAQTITLPFSGSAIREAGLDGPYTVKNLYITPIDLGITTQNVTTAWTTAGYQHSQFGIHSCYRLTLSHTGSGANPTAVPANSSGCAAGEYTPGATIDLTAIPSAGWHPLGWTGTINDATTEVVNTAIMPAGHHSVTVNYVPVTNSASTLYMTENQGTLRSVNQTTGATTAIGNLGTDAIVGLSNRPGDGVYIYGVGTSGPNATGPSRLIKIDRWTGNSTLLPVFDDSILGIPTPTAYGIAISPTAPNVAVVSGVYLDSGVHPVLWKVNVSTGSVLGAAIPTAAWLNELAYNLDGSVLYGTDIDGRLVTVNANTGSVTLVGDPGLTGSIEGLAFRPGDGALFAIDGFDQDRLVRLDPSNGSLLQVVGNFGVVGPYGLAFVASNDVANINVKIRGQPLVTYVVPLQGSLRKNYDNVDNGPVKVTSTDNIPIIASERINLKKIQGVASYSEFMGLPASKLTDTYIFPWYNNATAGGLSSQLRFANVGSTATDVMVKIGGVSYGPYHLNPNGSQRISFDNVDAGPVEVKSSNGAPIIAAMRINLKTVPNFSSYSEFLGLSASSTGATKYIFPWYNNALSGGLSSQLRFGNVGNATTTVTIKVGGATQAQTYILAPNESARVELNDVDNGPVEVFSSNEVPIIASMRVNLKSNPTYSSYSEFMGLPGATLTETRYLFPWYNNATNGGLSSQLRFGNVGNANTTVTIKIAGVAQSKTYTLAPNESARVELTNVDSGPVEVISSNNVPIIASMRVNLKSGVGFSSYSEFIGLSVGAPLGLPGNELSTTYWFPWYNNATNGGLNSQLRFGVP